MPRPASFAGAEGRVGHDTGVVDRLRRLRSSHPSTDSRTAARHARNNSARSGCGTHQSDSIDTCSQVAANPMNWFGFILAQCLNALSQASILFFIACGLTLIFGIMRIVNFAHGVIFMLAPMSGTLPA
jgi:hypothetical protein